MIALRLCRLGFTVVMAAALVVGVARAETVVVKPTNLAQTGWVVATQKGSEFAEAAFATGPEQPPAGVGSFHMRVGHSAQGPLSKVYLGTNKLHGVALDKITQLKLWICPKGRESHNGQPGQVEIVVSTKNETRLLTYYTWGCPAWQYCGIGKWQEFDLLSKQGVWVWTNTDTLGNRGNWTWVLGRFPGASIGTPQRQDWPHGTIAGTGLNIKIGAGKALSHLEGKRPMGKTWTESSECDAYVDKLTVGYIDNTGKEIVTTYDFEPQ